MAKRPKAMKAPPMAMADEADWQMERLACDMCMQHPRVKAIKDKIKADLEKTKAKYTKAGAIASRTKKK